MQNRNYLLLLCFILSSQLLCAQVPALNLQPEEPSYLPAISVNVKKTPSYTPKTELINIIEQNGQYPYNGHECEDASASFEEGDNGTRYGSDEYSGIKLRITQYGAQAKQIFSQLKPFDEVIRQLQQFASSSTTEPDNVGTRKSRKVTTIDVTSGKMVLVNDIITCAESHYKEYSVTSFRSVALIGTTIINIMGTYNNDDIVLAKKIHLEILGMINKGFKQ